jgi:hypothetical protein
MYRSGLIAWANKSAIKVEDRPAIRAGDVEDVEPEKSGHRTGASCGVDGGNGIMHQGAEEVSLASGASRSAQKRISRLGL